MSFRTRTARWFEILVPRPSIARTIEILAGTGAVELDCVAKRGVRPPDFSGLMAGLAEYKRLQQQYGDDWPEPRTAGVVRDVMLEDTLLRKLEILKRWEEEAGPVIRERERIARERHDMQRLRDFLQTVADDTSLDFTRMSPDGPTQSSVLFVLPPASPTPKLAEPILYRRTETEDHTYLLILGPSDEVQELTRALGGRVVRPVPLPDWLSGSPPEALAAVEARIGRLEDEFKRLDVQLLELNRKHGLTRIVGDIQRVEWLAEHLSDIPVSEYMAYLTGWTDDPSGQSLLAPLHEAGIPAVMGFPNPPKERIPPTLIDNPAWARPFELFIRMLGTPGRDETDPSQLVAVIVPLLFGYMFGDLGQGAVLLVAGLWLRRYWPVMSILISGGLAAMFFGLLFGSVFAREDLVPALWLHPIEAPLTVLAVPLFGGAVLMVIGLLLNGLAAWWGRKFGAWLRIDAGVVVMYLGAVVYLASGVDAAVLTVAAGLAWYLVGSALEMRGAGLGNFFARMGELLERLLQLLVNTLSFLRVGAFALAHAGLSVAVMELSRSLGNPLAGVLALVVGNAVILALEGLVVGIQTTRLVLFEFFIRFLEAGGRPFRPLAPPQPAISPGSSP